MTNLNIQETADIDGGFLPLIVGGVVILTGAQSAAALGTMFLAGVGVGIAAASN